MPTSRRRAALAAPDQQRAAATIKVELVEIERLLNAQPGAPQPAINARARLRVAGEFAIGSAVVQEALHFSGVHVVKFDGHDVPAVRAAMVGL